jgi:phosphoglucomutase
MGVGTNRINIYTVGMATQGLCNYLNRSFPGKPEIKIAIAHDCRNNSRLYAETSAGICAANGIRAYLFDGLRPTPELSFAIRYFGCQSGIVITASHNPKEYNGYKVYWEDGGQIIEPHDTNIIKEVQKIRSIDEVKFRGPDKLVEIIDPGFDDIYLAEIVKLSLSPQAVKNQKDLRIVYTPIHGSGVHLVPGALDKFGFRNVIHIPEQDVNDGNFPTVVSPNPEESAALAMALKKAEETGAELVMGTDPDADRVGIAVRNGKDELVLLNGNQTGALLLYYLAYRWKELGRLKGREYFVKTIVTSELMAAIARKSGLEIYDVLTGFKFIADIMKQNEGKKTFILGAEESYGYLAGDFVRDKDAVMSCALIAEAAAWAKDGGTSLYGLLLEIYCEFGCFRESLMSVYRKGKSGAEEIKNMMHGFRNHPPALLAGSKIIRMDDYELRQSTDTRTGKITPLTLPVSDVLQYITEDETKVSIRPSGTEPKIKFYFSVRGELHDKIEYRKVAAALDQKIEEIKKELGIRG